MRSSQLLFWILMAVIACGLALLILTDRSGSVLGIENDRFASTLYLGVWGVVLAAALVASRIRREHFARNIAIWLFILLVLVAGYQYREFLGLSG